MVISVLEGWRINHHGIASSICPFLVTIDAILKCVGNVREKAVVKLGNLGYLYLGISLGVSRTFSDLEFLQLGMGVFSTFSDSEFLGLFLTWSFSNLEFPPLGISPTRFLALGVCFPSQSFSHLKFLTFGVSGTWNFSDLEFLRLGFSPTWSFSHLDFLSLGFSPTWSFSNLDFLPLGVSPTWSFSHLDFLPLGVSFTWIFSHLEFFQLGFSPTWSFSHLEFLELGISVTWIFSHLEFLQLGVSPTWIFSNLDFLQLGVSWTWIFSHLEFLFQLRVSLSQIVGKLNKLQASVGDLSSLGGSSMRRCCASLFLINRKRKFGKRNSEIIRKPSLVRNSKSRENLEGVD